MRSFLVEAYLPDADARAVAALARRAKRAEKEGIRHLGLLAVADDEICFHLFAARSARTVGDAIERAELASDRIVEAIWIA